MWSKWNASALTLTLLVSGCSTSWLPWSRSDSEQSKRLPEGAVELQCAQNKTLVMRHAADGKSVWVYFPDRQFRLDRTSGTGERYSNGATTLSVDAESIFLDADGTRMLSDCKRKAQS